MSTIDINRELLAALKNLVAGRPVYRSKAIGAPGSVARIEQEYEIRLEDEALGAIARAEIAAGGLPAGSRYMLVAPPEDMERIVRRMQVAQRKEQRLQKSRTARIKARLSTL